MAAVTACSEPSGDDSPEELRLPAIDDDARADAAEAVSAILEDGRVTDVEYETAFFNMYDCVTDSGIELSAPSRDAEGLFEFLTDGIDGIETSPIEARYQECESLHYLEVAGMWMDQNDIGRSSPQADFFWRCLLGPDFEYTTREALEQMLERIPDAKMNACVDVVLD